MDGIRKIVREVLKESLEIEGLENINLIDKLKPYLIDGKFLYHYTLTDNFDSIKSEGLIPRREPNSHYPSGVKGVFLTTSNSLYNANLPQSLMDIMNDYYEEESEEIKPIVRLKIDVSNLDKNKFIWDDDYILNRYGWNKAENRLDKIIESIDKWGAIAYLDVIDKSNIVGYDFNYSN